MGNGVKLNYSKTGYVNVKFIVNLTFIIIAIIFLFFIYVFSINFKSSSLFLWAIIASIIGLLILITVYAFLKKMFNSVRKITDYTASISKGDLNLSDIVINSDNELASLGLAFNSIKSNLLFFIEQTKNNFLTISDAVDSMSSSVHNNYEGNSQVALAEKQISLKTQEQLEMVEKTIKSLNQVYSRIETIILYIKNTEKIISNTTNITGNGFDNIGNYNDQINIIFNNLINTADFIGKLKENINEINGISEFITGISNKLKMLALNASIEAAGAGEAGKGFSVVANETMKISDAAKEGILKISGLVKNIMVSSNSVAESINSSINNFEKGKELFKHIDQIFNEIDQQSNVVFNQMTKISEEISLIRLNAQDASSLNQNLYDASNIVTSSTQELAAITQDGLNGLREISGSTSSLSSMLLKIQKLTGKFNTTVKIVNKSPEKPLKICVISPSHAEFWNSVKQGGLYAKRVLKERNTDVEWIDVPDLTAESFIKKIKECVNRGCDGLAVVGFFEEAATSINEAVDKGIPVMTFNGDFKQSTKRMAFFGQNPYEAGLMAGKMMVKELEGIGEIGIITSSFKFNDHNSRINGFKDAIKKRKAMIVVIEQEANDDDDMAYIKTKELISANPNLKAIFIVAGGITGVAKAVEELCLANKLKIVCFDFIQSTINYIKKGVISSSIGQDAFGQGYNPIIYIYNYLVNGDKPEGEKMWSRVDVVNSTNVDDILS